MAINNPYWDEINNPDNHKLPPEYEMFGVPSFFVTPDFALFMRRQVLVKKYAWSITSPLILEAIRYFMEKISKQHILEIGAGNGYWAYVLSQCGLKIKAYDSNPWEEQWHPVTKGDSSVCSVYSDHVLMLCWPPYDDPMALNCLKNYSGNTIIYLGEWEGCTACDDFHKLLADNWTEKIALSNKNYDGIHDCLYILQRISK